MPRYAKWETLEDIRETWPANSLNTISTPPKIVRVMYDQNVLLAKNSLKVSKYIKVENLPYELKCS